MQRGVYQASPPLDWFTVALICALPEELAACKVMLDREIRTANPLADDNIYDLGTIEDHYVVVVCLPATKTNTDSAAAVARDLKRSFKNIRFGLLVGTGGGIPSEEVDIRLGDVVVSQPENNHGGVVYYDSGKTTETGFKAKQHLNKPPDFLLSALSHIRSDHLRKEPKMMKFLTLFDENLKSKGFAKPHPMSDRLFRGNKENRRLDRKDPNPRIWYGLIASGNKVIRDESCRDSLSDRDTKILCVEMEAAGLMDRFPCLVIRGISDYADKHKNDTWKNRAAACAAAYARELLSIIPASQVRDLQPIQDSLVTGATISQSTKHSRKADTVGDQPQQILDIVTSTAPTKSCFLNCDTLHHPKPPLSPPSPLHVRLFPLSELPSRAVSTARPFATTVPELHVDMEGDLQPTPLGFASTTATLIQDRPTMDTGRIGYRTERLYSWLLFPSFRPDLEHLSACTAALLALLSASEGFCVEHSGEKCTRAGGLESASSERVDMVVFTFVMILLCVALFWNLLVQYHLEHSW